MYQNCNCNGMGFLPELLSAAGSVLGSGKDGGSGGGSSPITVSPTISTQISPQISPIFQQQFQPQNSAATAGTAQTLPGSPVSGGIPGQMVLPTPTPVQAQTDYTKYMPYALAALGLLALVSIKRKKPVK